MNDNEIFAENARQRDHDLKMAKIAVDKRDQTITFLQNTLVGVALFLAFLVMLGAGLYAGIYATGKAHEAVHDCIAAGKVWREGNCLEK